MPRDLDFTACRGRAVSGAHCSAGIEGCTRCQTRTEGVHLRRCRRGRHLCDSDRQMARRTCDDNSFASR
jgi:hypothetical protein